MEEVATCKSCKCQRWMIYRSRLECDNCGKEYKFDPADEPDAATKASDLVNLVNDNH